MLILFYRFCWAQTANISTYCGSEDILNYLEETGTKTEENFQEIIYENEGRQGNALESMNQRVLQWPQGTVNPSM